MEALIKNHTITHLSLRENDIGLGNVENLKILSDFLIKNQTITNLNLHDNGLESQDIIRGFN